MNDNFPAPAFVASKNVAFENENLMWVRYGTEEYNRTIGRNDWLVVSSVSEGKHTWVKFRRAT